MAQADILTRWNEIEPRCALTHSPLGEIRVRHCAYLESLMAPGDCGGADDETPLNSSSTLAATAARSGDADSASTGRSDEQPPPTTSTTTTSTSARRWDELGPLEFLASFGVQRDGSLYSHARRSFDASRSHALLAAEMHVTKGAGPVAAPATKREMAFALMRSAVSQNKVRFQEDGFDLDLTYITDRIIAMGFPSHGRESYFRNPVDEVERFFRKRHKGHFRVYNLCSERHYESDSRFGGRFRRFPFDDHNPPCPIRLIPDLCHDAAGFLKEHEDNVVAIHCKAGKGRTGLMVACLLMFINPALRAPGDALAYFGDVRTSDGKGVTIPSQMRYVRYWDAMMAGHSGLEPLLRALRLCSVATKTAVRSNGGSCDLYFLIEENGKEVFDSRTAFKQGIGRAADGGFVFDLGSRLAPAARPVLCGDLKFAFFHRNKMFSDEPLFHFWLNSTLCALREELPKLELDKACKDKKHEVLDANLAVIVTFEEVPDDPRALQSQKTRSRSGMDQPSSPIMFPGAMASPPTDSAGALRVEAPTSTAPAEGTEGAEVARSAGAPGSLQHEPLQPAKKEGSFLSRFFTSK